MNYSTQFQINQSLYQVSIHASSSPFMSIFHKLESFKSEDFLIAQFQIYIVVHRFGLKTTGVKR